MKKLGLTLCAVSAALFLFPAVASAHVVPGSPHAFHDGFTHPLTGLDHLLAMIAVGLWAAQQRGRAVWLIPLTFVGVMALGGALGMAGAYLPGAELGIVASVLVLGGLIATMARFHPSLAMMVVGFFAMFHGYAHGREMPGATGAWTFSLGFLAATVLLHAAGLGLGFAMKSQRAVRWAGAAIALSSLCFLAA
ncbi:MAG TPA: HupE/UreJ family protein [Verrucomicrobiae bacterium]|jgi:urease accessory protein|nr:HupE/UreJ family protein [Verrucomicrobiae bacterium]